MATYCGSQNSSEAPKIPIENLGDLVSASTTFETLKLGPTCSKEGPFARRWNLSGDSGSDSVTAMKLWFRRSEEINRIHVGGKRGSTWTGARSCASIIVWSSQRSGLETKPCSADRTQFNPERYTCVASREAAFFEHDIFREKSALIGVLPLHKVFSLLPRSANHGQDQLHSTFDLPAGIILLKTTEGNTSGEPLGRRFSTGTTESINAQGWYHGTSNLALVIPQGIDEISLIPFGNLATRMKSYEVSGVTACDHRQQILDEHGHETASEVRREEEH
ncbi:hypothetical protein BJ322DRAFT_1017822 [Thelephora terrestris]|uniref:Uncharacterized protein n=1 Tax=Thelephora terrestris TaxID=56493 RepID=A0A9P6HNV3_9AGAM|nr:hypothetical protein BJ322DRAFT_1017822 [Thelephora terrestris]